MRRRDFLTGCLMGAATAGTACLGRKPSGLRKIRLTAGRGLTMSSLYLAHELGYFREEGFDLEILQIPNPLDAMTLLAGSKIDVAFAGLVSSFLSAAAKKLPIKIVAGREIASPVCGNMGSIYGLRRTFPDGLENPMVLKGKRVSAGPTIGFTHFALDAQLESVGLTGSDVQSVNLPTSQAAAALIGGQIDAAVLNIEFDRNLIAKASEIVRGPGLARYHPNFQCSHILFGESLLSADPGIGTRFLYAYLRGAREFAQGATPRYMEEFARSAGLDVKLVTGACRSSFAADGSVDLKSLQLFTDWAVRRKFIPQTVNIAELVDLRFIGSLHEK
jgi:ABC-type nitrate/sulfonate/bicarbonate transport system substrate-binding protein